MNNGKRSLQLWLEKDLRIELQAEARRQRPRLTMAAYVRQAIAEKMERERAEISTDLQLPAKAR